MLQSVYSIRHILGENMLEYLSADICSEKRTVSFEEQKMSQDKYSSKFSRQIKATVLLNIFRNTRGFENWGISFAYSPV